MKISNFKFQISNLEKGFTLVELLVVIGVLGVLASGLLATIDPLEQFRKAADSNRRSTSIELVNAMTRYYSVHQAFPWDTVANGGAGCTNPTGTIAKTDVYGSGATVSTTPLSTSCLNVLVKEGELKSTFLSAQILEDLYITDITEATTNAISVAVCFNPASKSLSQDVTTKYDSLGAPNASCPSAVSTVACFYCAN